MPRSPVSAGARRHAEWLALLDVSGPFLSLPVLQRAFPQGLDAHDAVHTADLRLAYAEWRERAADPTIHQAWIRFVLRHTLELTDEVLRSGQSLPPGLSIRVAEQHETLRPDFAVCNPDGAGKPRLLLQVYPADQALERPVVGHAWKASPATRMMDLLRGANVRLGLATNGEQWLLVNAPAGETTGFATWHAELWFDEPITLRAFRSLLSARRFFGVAEEHTPEVLLIESARDQEEVTDQLGLQVRRAVEVLIQAIDRVDQDRRRTLLAGMGEQALYQAAVTVMMRLVFLLSAEERGLFPLGDAFYSQHYAVAPLRDQLRADADRHGEEILERRCDAWSRLLATFRVVHDGVRHERMRLPAYGGSLFDPDRFPFLEGRAAGTRWRETPADPLPIHNRTVLHLLEALQLLQVRGAGGAEARRVSFRALDIEQIGHVYESLLDHRAARAEEPVLGLRGTKGLEPEIPLSILDAQRKRGRDVLIDYVAEATGMAERTVGNRLDEEVSSDDTRYLVACGNDPALLRQVTPYANLIRDDSAALPVIVPAGSVYVTRGSDRRTTGTHYTPRALTETIVKHTLDALVYEGPAEGTGEEQWTLKPPRALLDLKVCDFAMGSGAFLVQACRYLSERLVEAWEGLEAASPGKVLITPEGELSNGKPVERPIPKDPDERLAIARRLVVDRCLYGVDKDPMAVEMAKLSLWLITLQKDRAFTFVDHALRVGDSLLGLRSLEQIVSFHLDPASGHQIPLFAKVAQQALATARAKRERLESFSVREIRDAETKAQLLREADAALDDVRLLGDLIAGAAIAHGAEGRAFDAALENIVPQVTALFSAGDAAGAPSDGGRHDELRQRACALLDHGRETGQPERRTFHWPLEFPEVFGREASGFDAIVSNPPFQGGQRITGALGTDYRDYLVAHLAGGQRGSADLCAYFFLRAASLLRDGGGFGMLATNTIAQGDTREVGLDQIVHAGSAVTRANPSQKWPGSANLEIAQVWVNKGAWRGRHVLDERAVRAITPQLTVPGKVEGKPCRLAANAGKSFQGSIVLGLGFVLTPEQAQALIAKDRRNRDVLVPYLNGEDLNSRPDQSPSRWVINFRDWPLEKAETYPDCMRIVREKVKPERDRNNRKVYRDRWWHYAEKRPELYATIARMDRVLVRARVSNTHSIAIVPAHIVCSEQIVLIAAPEFSWFALLQAAPHTEWTSTLASSMRTDIRYTPSDCFETFPFPTPTSRLESIGKRYYEHRHKIMRSRNEGLTKTYNRFHDPKETAADIAQLRALHVELDVAVRDAYGWGDLDLGHDFHPTKQGVRFTLSERARREVLDRLLALNHERYAEEVAQGLHAGKARSKARRTKPTTTKVDDLPLFGANRATDSKPKAKARRR